MITYDPEKDSQPSHSVGDVVLSAKQIDSFVDKVIRTIHSIDPDFGNTLVISIADGGIPFSSDVLSKLSRVYDVSNLTFISVDYKKPYSEQNPINAPVVDEKPLIEKFSYKVPGRSHKTGYKHIVILDDMADSCSTILSVVKWLMLLGLLHSNKEKCFLNVFCPVASRDAERFFTKYTQQFALSATATLNYAATVHKVWLVGYGLDDIQGQQRFRREIVVETSLK